MSSSKEEKTRKKNPNPFTPQITAKKDLTTINDGKSWFVAKVLKEGKKFDTMVDLDSIPYSDYTGVLLENGKTGSKMFSWVYVVNLNPVVAYRIIQIGVEKKALSYVDWSTGVQIDEKHILEYNNRIPDIEQNNIGFISDRHFWKIWYETKVGKKWLKEHEVQNFKIKIWKQSESHKFDETNNYSFDNLKERISVETGARKVPPKKRGPKKNVNTSTLENDALNIEIKIDEKKKLITNYEKGNSYSILNQIQGGLSQINGNDELESSNSNQSIIKKSKKRNLIEDGDAKFDEINHNDDDDDESISLGSSDQEIIKQKVPEKYTETSKKRSKPELKHKKESSVKKNESTKKQKISTENPKTNVSTIEHTPVKICESVVSFYAKKMKDFGDKPQFAGVFSADLSEIFFKNENWPTEISLADFFNERPRSDSLCVFILPFIMNFFLLKQELTQESLNAQTVLNLLPQEQLENVKLHPLFIETNSEKQITKLIKKLHKQQNKKYSIWEFFDKYSLFLFANRKHPLICQHISEKIFDLLSSTIDFSVGQKHKITIQSKEDKTILDILASVFFQLTTYWNSKNMEPNEIKEKTDEPLGNIWGV